MRLDISHADPDPDLGDALPSGRDQADPISLRVTKSGRRRQSGTGHDELEIAAGRRIGQGLGVMIDLQHAAQRIEAVLILTSADGQQMVEGNACRLLPKRQHGGDVVG